MDDKVKQALNDLLSPVDLHKIVSFDKTKGIILIGGERATHEQLLNLQSEAAFLKESTLWSVLYETPKELAHRSLFTQGDSLDDLKKGRTILYTLSTQKNIIDILMQYNKTGK